MSTQAPETPSPRLRIIEYKNTVSRAFGLSLADLSDLQLASDGSDDRIFKTNAVERIGDFRVYVDTAQQLADTISTRLATACSWTQDTANCIQSELRPRFERLFRSPVSDADAQAWTTVFGTLRNDGATEAVALSAILYLGLLDERFLFHREQGEAADEIATTVTDSELASRLSYLLTDAPPDDALLAALNSGQLKSQLGAQIRRLYATDAADEMIWRFVSGWLSLPADEPPAPEPPAPIDECNFTSECKQIHGDQATDCVNSGSNMSWCACGAGVRCAPLPPPPARSVEGAAWEETRRFVLHIFKSDTLPISELFSANYSFIDTTLAEHYDVPAPAQPWQRYEFPENSKRTGILSHASFLSGNSSQERDVSWIFRGKAMYERMFCGELGLPQEGAISEPVEDRQNHPLCGSCHSIMDPLGKLFDGYDATGKYIGTELTDLPVLAFSDIDGNYQDLREFAVNVPNSRAFEHCFVRMLFRFVLGRKPSSIDQASYDEVLAVASNAGSAKAIMIKLLESAAFRMLHRDPSRRVCQ